MFDIEVSKGITISFLLFGKVILILLLVYVLALLTPKIAKYIDSKTENKKKNEPEPDERLYQVRSIFEPAPDDEKPLNTLFPEAQENNKTTRNEDE